jgi:hypothetical protein
MVEQPTHNVFLVEGILSPYTQEPTIILANEHVEMVATKLRVCIRGKYISKARQEVTGVNLTPIG